MTQSLTSYEKLEKLIKACIYKRWNCQTFVRFCNQLQESCDFDDVKCIGNALFSVATGGPLEPLFLEYICGLASDSKSLFPLTSLVEYLRETDDVGSGVKADVLIFIGKSLRSWNSNSLTIEELKKALAGYIVKLINGLETGKNDLVIEYKAVGYFLIKLGEYGQNTGLIVSLQSPGDFQAGLKKIIAKNDDKFVEKQLKGLFKLANDSDDSDNSKDNNDPSRKDTVDIAANGNYAPKPSRAHRLLFLESLMLSESRIQGNNFIRELNIFFAGENVQSIVSKLITTSFDCLAVALQRKDLPIYVPLWKGFIGKRLPLVIRKLIGNGVPIESSICNPISMLDRGTVNLLRVYGGGDALDEMFSSFPSTTSDIRHEFLKSCIDIGLIKRESLQQTLGEDANVVEDNNSPSYGPARSRYLLKDGNQVKIDEIFTIFANENPEHVSFDDSIIVWLVRIFDEIDGYRQQRISRSMLKFVQEWVDGQKTGSLSRICQALSLNTDTLDILFLHITPTSLLIPLIRFLDDWKDDEDENDFQEVYAHFGSVFLFIEVVYRRYALGRGDLKDDEQEQTTPQEDSFWLSYITSGLKDSIIIDDMSDDRKILLGGWVSALYDAGGISDDLMRLSSIQELIILVPTIFQQSITACAEEVIDQDTLKGGLDYFLQPFLLPTLLGAFKYLSHCLWSSKDIVQVLWVLNLLISPSGLSTEAMNIHKIVLSIVSTDLKQSLIDVKTRLDREHSAIDQLLISLEPHTTGTGRFAPNIPISNSLLTTMKDTINILVGWIQGLDQGHISGAPGYVLRCFSLAIDIIGSSKLVDLFLDELDFAEAQGSFDYAMDVISAIIMIMDPLGQHDRRGVTNRINSSVINYIENITEESIIQQREKKRKVNANTNNASSSSNSTNGNINNKPITNANNNNNHSSSSNTNNNSNITANATSTNLLLGSFRKLKSRIHSLQQHHLQQQKLLPIDDNSSDEDELAPDEILHAVNDIDLPPNDLLPPLSSTNPLPLPITANQPISTTLDTNIILDPNSSMVVDADGLPDVGLMGDLDLPMGDDDLVLGEGLDMSAFDTDEQLMLMDLT